METPPYACPWPLGPHRPALAQDEIHLWCMSLNLPARRLDALHSLLSEDEQARAARFRIGDVRDHFIAARGTLRVVLACYLDLRPAEVRFDYLPMGKPILAPGCGPGNVEFNLSHSHGVAVVGVGHRVLGVTLSGSRRAPAPPN